MNTFEAEQPYLARHVRAHQIHGSGHVDNGEPFDFLGETRECVHFHWDDPLTLDEATKLLAQPDVEFIKPGDTVTRLISCGADEQGNIGHVAALNQSDQSLGQSSDWNPFDDPMNDWETPLRKVG